jgi:hypothetical protein
LLKKNKEILELKSRIDNILIKHDTDMTQFQKREKLLKEEINQINEEIVFLRLKNENDMKKEFQDKINQIKRQYDEKMNDSKGN